MKTRVIFTLATIAFVLSGTRGTFGQTLTGDRLKIGLNHDLTGTYASIAAGQNNTNYADRSIIGGGIFNLIGPDADDAVISGGSNNMVLGEYGAVGGGYQNTALEYGTVAGGWGNTNAGQGAAIGGGVENTCGQFSSIAGGGYNNSAQAFNGSIGGGILNFLSGFDSAIGGGLANTNEGYYSVIAGGYSNSISSGLFGGAIGGGLANIATGRYGAIPGGAYALADKWGQQAYASGRFAANGDAQTSLFVVRNTTTNATPVDLFLNGSSSTLRRMTISSGSTWTFDILVSARSNNGDSAGYHLTGVIENVGGTVTLVGSVIKTVVAEDVAAWDANVAADNTNDALSVNVTGDTTNPVRWTATVRTSEVVY